MSTLPLPPYPNLTALQGSALLWSAIAEANRAHRHQPTKLGDGWYIAHPMHLLTIHLQCGFRVDDPEDLPVLIADTGHDGPEDCPEETSLDCIESLFGRRVRELVEAVTLDPVNPDKYGDREKLLALGWQEQSLKMADIAANSLRIAESIRQRGIVEVQEMLKQPLGERYAMERSFVERCLESGTSRRAPDHAHALRQFTLQTLENMRVAIETA